MVFLLQQPKQTKTSGKEKKYRERRREREREREGGREGGREERRKEGRKNISRRKEEVNYSQAT